MPRARAFPSQFIQRGATLLLLMSMLAVMLSLALIGAYVFWRAGGRR